MDDKSAKNKKKSFICSNAVLGIGGAKFKKKKPFLTVVLKKAAKEYKIW